MTDFKSLVFMKNATNGFGRFKKGDRAQARFPKELVESYVKHGILAVAEKPIALDKAIKNYGTEAKSKK